MVRRLMALGAAVALALSLSVTSFAEVDGNRFSFPYFCMVRLTQGSATLVSKTPDPDPTGANKNNYLLGSYSSSFSNSVSGTINMYLYPCGKFTSGGTPITNYCDYINGGSYSIDGYLEFDSSSDIDTKLLQVLGRPTIRVNDGTDHFEDFAVVNYEYRAVNGTNNKRVHYSFVFDVASSIENYSYISFSVPVTGSYPIIGWSIYTGAVDMGYIDSEVPSNPSNVMVNMFSRLFNFLGAGFTRVVDAVKDDSDAQQAAEIADQQSVESGQSQIAAVESFEASTSQSISSGVSTINNSGYLVVPDYTSSSSGMGAALAAIGWIFAGVFNRLGGYQVVITVPLVLGIMLILVGRGTLALGRVISANARAARREKGSGGNA